MLVNFNQIRDESVMSTLPFDAGSIYICGESKHVYFDSVITPGDRILINTISIIKTENDRVNITSPLEDHLYFVTNSRVFYIYADGEWVRAVSGSGGGGAEWDGLVDETLTLKGVPADAKATGDAISKALIDSKEYTDSKIKENEQNIKKYIDETILGAYW